jgi:hypothetical protein
MILEPHSKSCWRSDRTGNEFNRRNDQIGCFQKKEGIHANANAIVNCDAMGTVHLNNDYDKDNRSTIEFEKGKAID